ncbi:hypothetical protein Tco_1047015 [Tanacetum coccineum]
MDCETANLPYLLAQYLFRFAEGRKSRARLSGGHFIRLNICLRYGDRWAWVALGPERQQAATAGAPTTAEGDSTNDEGAQAVPAPVQAPQSLPPAPQPHTMS